MNKIHFHELATKSSLTNRLKLKKFFLSIFKKEEKLLERVDIIFCTDEFLFVLNKDFLQHENYTDTMSFVLSDLEDPIVGEVYISIDRIKENSKEMNVSYKTELLRVIIHGILHLCGYLDKPKSAAIKMHKTQEAYLRLCSVSRGT